MSCIIDDRPYAPDPAKEGQKIFLIARKFGTNGNLKKTVIFETTGGEHTAALMEQLSRETAHSRVEISATADSGECRPGDYCKNETEFIKCIKKMMK